MAFRKMAMLILCSRNTSLALNCPSIQCRDYTKHNTETDTVPVKGPETHTCTTENPELGSPDWKTSCRNIYDFVLFLYFHMLKISAYKICPNQR